MGQLQQQLAADGDKGCFFGVDVSKTAVKLAAKRYPITQFVVADVWAQAALCRWLDERTAQSVCTTQPSRICSRIGSRRAAAHRHPPAPSLAATTPQTEVAEY